MCVSCRVLCVVGLFLSELYYGIIFAECDLCVVSGLSGMGPVLDIFLDELGLLSCEVGLFAMHV